MKRVIGLLLMLLLASCGYQDIDDMNISNIYTDKDIEDAINCVESYFKENFSGCTLIDINYAGDSYEAEFVEYAHDYDAYEAIILTSTFMSDESGGDGSLEINMTYEDFNWILVRNQDGEWIHKDHGY